jgi:hypothetical protein
MTSELTDHDSLPGALALTSVQDSIFRIEARGVKGVRSATCFTVALFRDAKRHVFATAKHVVHGFARDETVQWRIQQFDRLGDVTRSFEFESNESKKGGTPYLVHNVLDLALIWIPDEAVPHTLAGEKPVRIIKPVMGVAAGTRVGWAGFPGQIEALLGFPQLSYFEGSVSAMVDLEQRGYYLVDGHNSQGLSGGPVWHWSHEHGRAEVVAIVSGYSQVTEFPGFCKFESISPLPYKLVDRSWWPNPDDHMLCEWLG